MRCTSRYFQSIDQSEIVVAVFREGSRAGIKSDTSKLHAEVQRQQGPREALPVSAATASSDRALSEVYRISCSYSSRAVVKQEKIKTRLGDFEQYPRCVGLVLRPFHPALGVVVSAKSFSATPVTSVVCPGAVSFFLTARQDQASTRCTAVRIRPKVHVSVEGNRKKAGIG